MAKTFKARWLGDSDPMAQMVRMGDLTFVKGESVSVPEDHDFAERIIGNPMFAVDDAKAEPVEADEPDAEEIEQRADEGTEKGALKAQLKRDYGVTMAGNPSVDTLRKRLADEAAKRD
jgi:hypothetical protein